MKSSEGWEGVQHRIALKEDSAPLQGTANLRPSAVHSKWTLPMFNCFSAGSCRGFFVLTERNIPLQRAARGIYSSIVMCQMIHLLRFTFPVWIQSQPGEVGLDTDSSVTLSGRKAQCWPEVLRHLSETFLNLLFWSYFSSA